MQRHEHTRSCRHQRALGSQQATQDVLSSPWQKELPEGLMLHSSGPFRRPMCFQLEARGFCVSQRFRAHHHHVSVNLKSQQMEAKGCGAGRRKKVDTDQD